MSARASRSGSPGPDSRASFSGWACPPSPGPCSIEISLSAAAWRAVLDELVPAVESLDPSAIKPAPDDERVLLPIWPDAARALGIGRTKLFQLIGDGEIETVTIGRRVLIPADALRDYVQRLRLGDEA